MVFDPACQYQGVSLTSFLCKDPCLIGNPLGVPGPYIAGVRGEGGQLPSPGKLIFFFFFFNIVFEFDELFLVAILVRNHKKID